MRYIDVGYNFCLRIWWFVRGSTFSKKSRFQSQLAGQEKALFEFAIGS